MPDRDIDADDAAVLLVKDGVDRDGGLADRAVADDQLALAPAKRKQRIDRNQASLHRFGHRIALDDCRGGPLDRHQRFPGDRALPVERTSQRVDDAAEQCFPGRYPHHVSGGAHAVARLDAADIIEQHAADTVRVEHLRKAELAMFETQQFVEPDLAHARNQRDAVTHLFDAADLFRPSAERQLFDAGARRL